MRSVGSFYRSSASAPAEEAPTAEEAPRRRRGRPRGQGGQARAATWPPSPVPLKALVWFWLIDETLSANLVYQSDYEIGSTAPSDEATAKIMTMVMAW